MANTSATGGPLVPTVDSPAPLEGLSLNQFLQSFVAGVVALDGTLVRPRFQGEPPVIPPAATAWAAVGSQSRRREVFPYIEHNPTGNGYDILQRQEELDVLCSFYDLGTNGRADELAALLQDGLGIAQNREVLQLAGMQLAAPASEGVALPTVVNARWHYRVDVSFQIRRAIRRYYPVYNLLRARVDLHANDAGNRVINSVINVEP